MSELCSLNLIGVCTYNALALSTSETNKYSGVVIVCASLPNSLRCQSITVSDSQLHIKGLESV